jgi:hypothetical protein
MRKDSFGKSLVLCRLHQTTELDGRLDKEITIFISGKNMMSVDIDKQREDGWKTVLGMVN